MNIIILKSIPDNWKKEKLGLKSNTIRFTDDWDNARWNQFYNATHVVIKKTTDDKDFLRKITDKTVYKNIAIISWG